MGGWRWQTAGAAAVLGAAIVLAVAAVLRAGDDAPAPVATPVAIATATPTPAPTIEPEAGRLLAYAGARVEGCALDSRALPRGATARVRCTFPGRFPAVLTRFAGHRALRAYFHTLARGRPARLGACAPDGRWWTAGKRKHPEGRLIGRRAGSRLVLAWTDAGDRVAAFARAPKARASRLCAAWEKYA